MIDQVEKILDEKWMQIAILLAGGSAFLFFVVRFFFGWRINLLYIVAALCLATFPMTPVKNRLVLVAIPLAIPAAIQFVFIARFSRHLFGFSQYGKLLILAGVVVVFVLAALDKFKNKQLAFIINLCLTGVYAWLFNIFTGRDVIWLLAFVLFLASGAVYTFATKWEVQESYTTSLVCQKCSKFLPKGSEFCPSCGKAVSKDLNLSAQHVQVEKQNIRASGITENKVIGSSLTNEKTVAAEKDAEKVAAEKVDNNEKMSYNEATVIYNRLNQEKIQENRKAALISIICAAAAFAIGSIILNFFDGSMFSTRYYVDYDIGFFRDFLIAVVVYVSLWGGWAIILKFSFTFVMSIWASRHSLSGDDIYDLRQEAEKILQRDPSQVAEAEALNKKADEIEKVLLIVDESKLYVE